MRLRRRIYSPSPAFAAHCSYLVFMLVESVRQPRFSLCRNRSHAELTDDRRVSVKLRRFAGKQCKPLAAGIALG